MSERRSVFISHAGEDKCTLAMPFFRRLQSRGIRAFLDSEELQVGDNAPDVMDRAMETASVGVFILSPEFAAKKWPMKELQCFLRREAEAEKQERVAPLLVPVFYRLDLQQCNDRRFFYRHEGGRNAFLDCGFFERMSVGETSTDMVMEALGRLSKHTGIENMEGATNAASEEMQEKRERLLDVICEKVMQSVARMEGGSSSCHHDVPCTVAKQRDMQFCPTASVPPNPAHIVLDFDSKGSDGRPLTCEARVKASVLEHRHNVPNITAIVGMSGVGKSCTLLALAHDTVIRTRFADGIYLVSLGMDATVETVVKEIRKIVHLSDGQLRAEELRRDGDINAVLERAAVWFKNRRFLLLLDDVAESNGLGAVTVRQFSLLVGAGEQSAMVFTTRDRRIALQGKTISFVPREPFGLEARSILFRCANSQEEDLWLPGVKDAVALLLQMCDGLPVALAIVGKAVALLASCLMDNKERAWELYLSTEKDCRRKWLQRNDSTSYPQLSSTFTTAIRILDERQSELLPFAPRLSFKEMHRAFCVIEKQAWVPMTVLRALWSLRTLDEARAVAEQFVFVNLANMQLRQGGKSTVMGLRLHDLIHDFACAEAENTNETADWHARLLDGYGVMNGEKLCLVDGCREWWLPGIPYDEYFQNNWARHLQGAGLVDEMRILMERPEWGLELMRRDLEMKDMAVLRLNEVVSTMQAQLDSLLQSE